LAVAAGSISALLPENAMGKYSPDWNNREITARFERAYVTTGSFTKVDPIASGFWGLWAAIAVVRTVEDEYPVPERKPPCREAVTE